MDNAYKVNEEQQVHIKIPRQKVDLTYYYQPLSLYFDQTICLYDISKLWILVERQLVVVTALFYQESSPVT